MIRLFCLRCLISAMFLCGVPTLYGGATSAAANSTKLDTTSSTYVLFLDMTEIESLHNIELVVNQAKKHEANPVLPTGDLNDFDYHQASAWAGSIIFDEDDKVFKLWYQGGRGGLDEFSVGYAWSPDGVVWHKPKLRLYEYRGSKGNNICFQSPTGISIMGKVLPSATDQFEVFKDYREPDPQKRYKGMTRISSGSAKKNFNVPIYSADGLHWRLESNRASSYPSVDIANIFIDYDDPDPNRRIKIYGNGDAGAGFGPDIEHCLLNPNNPLIGGSIPHPNKDGLEDTIHYAWAFRYKGYYITLYDYDFWLPYYDYQGKVDAREHDPRVPSPKTGIFTGDTRLAVNRDGVSKFVRVNPHQAVIARGRRSDWDGGFIVMPGAVVADDKIYIFYTGVEEAGGISAPEWAERDDPTGVRLGLATLRLDGFTDLQTKDGLSQGTVTTKPIEVKQPEKARLVVNASHLMPYRDWIEVELRDADTDLPVEGYRRQDCAGLFQEGLRIPVEWTQHKTLDDVKARAIKIRFYLWGQAKLYSFHFDGNL